MLKKVGVLFPFDFLHEYGGASQRLKVDLKTLVNLGLEVGVLFPTKTSQSLLKQQGHELRVILRTYFNLQKVPFLTQRLKLLLDEYGQTLNPFYYWALFKYFKQSDLFFTYFPLTFLASYLIVGNKSRILYVALNFEYGLLKQTTRNLIIRKIMYYAERYTCSKAAKVLCVSEKDKFSIQNTYHIPSEKVIVLPNNIDVDYYSKTHVLYDRTLERIKLGIDPKSYVLIFPGRMDYRPNVEALNFILGELVPRLESMGQQFYLLVVGTRIPKSHLKSQRRMVSFYADVPDMRRFYAAADALIVPLNIGSGTRIKILEAFATKLPVISTAIGCEGIDCQDGKHILLARRKADDFVNKIMTLVKDTKNVDNITNAAVELVKEKYSTNNAEIFLQALLKN